MHNTTPITTPTPTANRKAMIEYLASRPLFSILHTSARPKKWREVYDAWIGAAKNPNTVEYCLTVDKRWGFAELPALRAQDKVAWNTARRCYVDGVNTSASQSTGLILIVNADDQYPCANWDEELIKCVAQIPVPEFVIWAGTGTTNEFQRRMMCMPILSRPRYDRLGYVFYPAYESMFADNDFCEHALADGVVMEAGHLLFQHRHPMNEGKRNPDAMDAAYQAQMRKEAWEIGRGVLNRRRENEFGKRTVVAMPAPVTTLTTPTPVRETLGVALPGEHFSSAWVFHWTQLFAELANQYHVHPNFAYSSSVYATRQVIFDYFTSLTPAPDYLLWIDDDNLVTPFDVAQLIADLKANPDVGIVAGWSWCTGDVYENAPYKPSVGRFTDAGIAMHLTHAELVSGDPLKEIDFTGFPIVLMRGSVITTLAKDTPFAPAFSPHFSYGFAGEDTSFCIAAKSKGIRILVDRRVKVPHLKLRSAEPNQPPAVVSGTTAVA
jgi:hypothetical protein